MEQEVEIYTDGGCEGNGSVNAIAAWAYVSTDESLVAAGILPPPATNNRAELIAVIEAIKAAVAAGYREITIRSDSQLTVQCARRLWKRKKNVDLWNELDLAVSGRSVLFEWVRGHAGNHWNERCDRMCAEAIRAVVTRSRELEVTYSAERPGSAVTEFELRADTQMPIPGCA